MLSPIEIHPDPRGPTRQLLVWEGFNPDPNDIGTENCTTIVAVLSGGRNIPDVMAPDSLFEWTAYQAAFNATQVGQDERVAYTISRGNKLNEGVARAMFPRLREVRFRL